MKAKIIGVSVAVILSLAAILLVSTVPYFILDDIPIEIKEYTSQKIVRTLTPTETILVPEIQTMETKEIKSSSIVEKIYEPSLSAQSFPFEAYAIGSTVNQVNFLKHTDSTLDYASHNRKQYAFDSNHNVFHGADDKISFFDRTALTKTIWTIPNAGSVQDDGMTTDSAGNVYFGQNGNILSKLVPSTDTFIQVVFGLPTSFSYDAMEVSSSGELFFTSSNSLGKVNFITGAVTLWPKISSFGSPVDMGLDSNGNFYYISGSFPSAFLHKIDPTTNALTRWTLTTDAFNSITMVIADNDHPYIYQWTNVRTKILHLDPTTNVLEEWFIPSQPPSFPEEEMAIDSARNVYFLEDLSRLVPSTGKFTKWSIFGGEVITVDSNDDVWIAGRGFFGKITATP